MKSTFRSIIALFLVGSELPLNAKPLMLDEILTTVRENYPPLLAAWLQQDIANGRVRQAQGAFDPILSATLATNPMNYYDGNHGGLFLEQPLAAAGANVYGGYRMSSGFLPDYERKVRTADGGEMVLGMRLPLLRDREFDSRRAGIGKAAIDRELANPFILRQYLTFHRSARIAYFNWLAAGKRLAVAEDIVEIATKRDDALKEQVKAGAIANITETDNRRLVVSREINVLNAQRAFESSSIELSLFHRDAATGDPITPPRSRLPDDFPKATLPDSINLINDRGNAAFRRPESREIELIIAKANIDRRLARNNLKPNLDLAFEFNQALGNGRPSDIDESELTGLLKFSVPIGNNESKGRISVIDGKLKQLDEEKKFTRERILADANDAYSALQATHQALQLAGINVALATELEAAENEKFLQGASDLLSLQIREQATFDAKVLEIDAKLASLKAMADYQAAIAADAPVGLLSRSQNESR
jgi:outer membrane protein TolC